MNETEKQLRHSIEGLWQEARLKSHAMTMAEPPVGDAAASNSVFTASDMSEAVALRGQIETLWQEVENINASGQADDPMEALADMVARSAKGDEPPIRETVIDSLQNHETDATDATGGQPHGKEEAEPASKPSAPPPAIRDDLEEPETGGPEKKQHAPAAQQASMAEVPDDFSHAFNALIEQAVQRQVELMLTPTIRNIIEKEMRKQPPHG